MTPKGPYEPRGLKKCQHCEGTGKVQRSPTRAYEPLKLIVCPKCGGSGYETV
jgi:DnaJ-class molecular chaperone